ncbi:MAG: hypothetical protein ACD_79C00485G0002 [uncultured bacterium]|nr:MAG: hypothetical protein ACD_79C00485G0002 [uncultured bacterium]
MGSNVKNVLASRYASNEMVSIWNEEGKILLEREFWIAVMKAQKELGVNVPFEAIESYEKVKNKIDPQSITNREKTLRHDVKARIEEFCALAGYEHIHKGLTSRDLTDNVEQYQVMKSLKIIKLKVMKALSLFAEKASEYKDLVIAARTHNVTAQPTTLGKRLSCFGEELLLALHKLDDLIVSYPLRGVKGAVGTVLDLKTIFNNDSEKVKMFQTKIARYLGFENVMNAVGQVYPRSLDFDVVAVLHRIGSAPSSFCKTLRLMAGHELVSEGFQKGQVGSSAMPHKMNSRNCERLNGFFVLLSGYLDMASRLSGDQWNEGDVSCSVVRRVMLPDSFFALDGLLDTLITILNEMAVFKNMIDLETKKNLPFLVTTTLLMEAVSSGIGREKAHEIIKKHSINVINDLRSGKISENDLMNRLALDSEFPMDKEKLDLFMKNTGNYLGEALIQVDVFCNSIRQIENNYPEIKTYTPQKLI